MAFEMLLTGADGSGQGEEHIFPLKISALFDFTIP